MVFIFDASIMIILGILAFCLLSAGSTGIVSFFNENLYLIFIICVILCIACLVAIFIMQIKAYKKAYLIITPIIALPSLIQFFYFVIHGIISIAQSHLLFSFFYY